jgi:hypothetical protein
MSSDSFFINNPFTISQNAQIYSETLLTNTSTYDYILEINIRDGAFTTPNSLFNTRTYQQNVGTQNSTGENLVDINLTINTDMLNIILYGVNSVDISSTMNNVVQQSAYNTLIKGSHHLLGLRFLEISATKIFGHAKARAAIANDTEFYLPYTSQGSLIQQISDGINNSIVNKKLDIFNYYVTYDRIELNPNNDAVSPINFNFDNTNWEFPIYYTTVIGDNNSGANLSLLSNGPNVGGNQLINGQLSVPILLKFHAFIPTTEDIYGTSSLSISILYTNLYGTLHTIANGAEVGLTKTITNKNTTLAFNTNFGTTNNTIQSMVVVNGILYVVGNFTVIGGTNANYIASWNGTSWSALGSGLSNSAYTISTDGLGNLYTGGDFITAGGVTVNRVVKYNIATSVWSSLGTGLASGRVAGSAFTNGNLFIIGTFTSINSVTVKNIARWNGTTWYAMGTENNIYNELVVDSNGLLYIAGSFSVLNGVYLHNIATWNGTQISPLKGINNYGTNEEIRAMAIDNNNNIYIGGVFTNGGDIGSGATVALTGHLAKWNGVVFSPVGSGVNTFGISTLVCDNIGNLYIGGSFTIAGGVSVVSYARYNIVTTAWSTVSSGLNSNVNCMSVYNNELYIGGGFTNTPSSYFTKIGLPNTITGNFKTSATPGIQYSQIEFVTNNQVQSITWNGTYWIIN